MQILRENIVAEDIPALLIWIIVWVVITHFRDRNSFRVISDVYRYADHEYELKNTNFENFEGAQAI